MNTDFIENTPLSPGEIFDRMAPGWYGFRHRSIFRPELEMMARRWRHGRLLNIGCAHGPDFPPFSSDFHLTGVDISPRMLILARKYAQKFGFSVDLVLGDAAYLPFCDNTFDNAIAIAVYHHIRGIERRFAALSELRRVLKPGGEAFLTVWNRRQPQFWGRCRETTVPWKTGNTLLPRYYYLYSYGEFVGQVRQAGLTVIRVHPESTYRFPLKIFSRNICLLVRR